MLSEAHLGFLFARCSFLHSGCHSLLFLCIIFLLVLFCLFLLRIVFFFLCFIFVFNGSVSAFFCAVYTLAPFVLGGNSTSCGGRFMSGGGMVLG